MFDAIGRGIGMILDYRNQEKNRDAAAEMAANNIALQREFAQNGIQWKAADAKAAGIHPLFAMGAQTSSFSPVSLGTQPESNFAGGLGSMGQDITRAINATRTQADRDEAFTKTMRGLQIEKATLENDALRTSLASSIARQKQNQNPPMPMVGPLEEDKAGKATPLMAGNNKLGLDRGWSDGQTYEDRWGEFGGGVAGLGVMAADLIRTAREKDIQVTQDHKRNLAQTIYDFGGWLDRNTSIGSTPDFSRVKDYLPNYKYYGRR